MAHEFEKTNMRLMSYYLGITEVIQSDDELFSENSNEILLYLRHIRSRVILSSLPHYPHVNHNILHQIHVCVLQFSKNFQPNQVTRYIEVSILSKRIKYNPQFFREDCGTLPMSDSLFTIFFDTSHTDSLSYL